ncbi:MAG: YeeE/YedE family protein [Alphaproteobacteria bacterium]|nr:YeeE/YedE family protein [Alphaproteobacteria bacterium]TAD89700.1 MAG: YeeE/YedE family protein [Alphaproteobacteria bacterium]
MVETAFTPWSALAGGVLIGLSAVVLMATVGRIAGISGTLLRVLMPTDRRESLGRLVFVVGLIAAPAIWMAVTGTTIAQSPPDAGSLVVIAGLLVGFGAVLGNGCTSGHGVCGLARLSPRSAVAVGVFMATALATVAIARHVI